MLLETRVLADHSGMFFVQVRCVFEVLNVEEVGEGGFGIIKIKILREKGSALTLVETAISRRERDRPADLSTSFLLVEVLSS